MRAVDLDADGLTLEPLRVAHAVEMVVVLADASIYEFIGGGPPTLEVLQARYATQARGASDDAAETWLNWIIRCDTTGTAGGYVQATVSEVGHRRIAEVAWVVGQRFQRRGIATAAAAVMAAFLRGEGAGPLRAHIHPDHVASQRVASALGMHPQPEIVDGEIRWEG